VRATLIRISMLAVALLASPVVAQPSQAGRDAAEDRDIVVTGERAQQPNWSQTTRQARSVTAPTGLRYTPLPRFEGDRLCPGVFGLKPEYASLVIDRVRDTAEGLDVWLAEDDGSCAPNFVVAFVDDGQATLRNIVDDQPWLFRRMPRLERRALLAEPGPARVWTSTLTRTRDGMPVAEDDTGRQVVQLWMAHSKIYLPTREDITGVLVLFDRDEVRGKSLLQLADYATMRGLARTKPPEGDGAGLDTILALFDEGATGPPELTDFDRAYLAALYDGIPNLAGLTKVNGVNRQLRRQAREQEPAAGD